MFAAPEDGYPAPVKQLATPRLRLRPFERGDLAAIHRVYSDPEVMRWVGTGPVADRATTERMLAGYAAHQRSHGFSFWAVLESASGALIGDAGLHRTTAGEVELGYTLGREWWGRGYATEAGRAWLAAAFGQLGIDEVIALAEPANAGSLHVLEKLGMQPRGTRMAFGREHLVYRIRSTTPSR
jgi:[ribosomal protein S5]-alanine N-acetyltransferase